MSVSFFARLLLAFGLAVFAGRCFAATVELQFVASAPAFNDATEEYRAIWEQDGARILRGLQRHAGVALPDRRVRVIVFEGVSNSGRRGGPMRLRASYAEPVKRATLVHELLHRHLDEVAGVAACYPEIHDLMSMMLFEMWTQLWGREFATQQAGVEAARSERYRRSWSKALAMTVASRRAAIAGIGSACR